MQKKNEMQCLLAAKVTPVTYEMQGLLAPVAYCLHKKASRQPLSLLNSYGSRF